MRIQNIQLANVICHESFALTPGQVTLICGPNGSGKSSLLESVRLALLGSSRAPLKKHWPSLVTTGHKKGKIAIDYQHEGHDGSVSITLPTGKVEGQGVEHVALPFALADKSSASLSPTQLRDLLFSLHNVKVDHQTVADRLRAAGLPEPMVEPLVRKFRAGGFDLAEKEAKTMASEKRGAWSEITGERYGANKAEDFEIEDTPDFDESLYQAAKSSLNDLETSLEHAIVEHARSSKPAIDHDDLERKAASLGDLEQKRETLQEQITNAQAEQSRLALEAKMLKEAATLECPHCHRPVSLHEGKLDLPLHSDLRQAMIEQNRQSWKELRDHIDKANQKILAIRTQIQVAKQAQAVLDAAAIESTPATQDWEPEIARLREAKKIAQQRLNELAETRRNTQSAKSIKEKALALHADVQMLQTAAQLLGPEGIIQELSQPIHDRCVTLLDSFTESTGWPVALDRDFQITFADRPLFLASESEQLRAEVAIQHLIATLSELQIQFIDRADLLDLHSRAQLFRWALQQGKEGCQVIIAATLKEAPNFPGYHTVWLGKEPKSDSVAAA